MTRTASYRRIAQAGFTLVELMVALGLSMILAIVLLKMQAALGQQRMRTSDIAERDAELRASMDIITQDMSSTAFLFGNMTQPCEAIFSYNGAGTAHYFTRHQVDAIAASSGTAMNFATSLTLNYPPSSTPSDVLVITSSNDASQFNDAIASLNRGDQNSATNPFTTGTMQLAIDQTPPVVGHTALVEAAIQNAAGTYQNACFRVPVTANPSVNVYTSSGTLMPPTFYAGFQPSLTAAGFGTLGNGQLLASPKYVDIGAPASPTQTTTAYYIDNSGAFPVLVRSQWSVLDDTAIGTPQQVAAGVVSLQARFNTGSGNYLTAAAVTSGGLWNQVCSVRVAIVTRSISDDPDPNYVWTPTAITPGTATSVVPGSPFSAVPVATAFQHRRFLLQTTELAVRNSLWSKGVAPTC